MPGRPDARTGMGHDRHIGTAQIDVMPALGRRFLRRNIRQAP